MLCKHFSTPEGCSYGDKCQYAHGPQELRTFMGNIPQSQIGNPHPNLQGQTLQKNPLNYKIVKCKNFEKTGTCKYNSHCTYAHGDRELRTREDNLNQIQPSLNNIMGQQALMLDYNGMMNFNNMNMISVPNMDLTQQMQQMNPADIGQMTMNGMFDPRAMFMMGMEAQNTGQEGNPANPQEKNEEKKENTE